MRSRVLVVDDHPLVRLGLMQLLSLEPDLDCGEADGAESAQAAMTSFDPDVVVLDLMLREGAALDLIRTLTEAFPAIPVLVLSMHDQRVYADRCLRAGASGYVMKEEAAETIAGAIREVLAGRTYLSPALVGSASVATGPGSSPSAASMPSPPPAASLSTLVAQLTDRELEIFLLIGDGANTRTIAERLGLSAKTVEAHKANIKGKLRADGAPHLLRLAIAWRETLGSGGAPGDRR